MYIYCVNIKLPRMHATTQIRATGVKTNLCVCVCVITNPCAHRYEPPEPKLTAPPKPRIRKVCTATMINICTYMYTHTYECMYVCMFVCMYVCMYV